MVNRNVEPSTSRELLEALCRAYMEVIIAQTMHGIAERRNDGTEAKYADVRAKAVLQYNELQDRVLAAMGQGVGP
jgi:hypothetical protein